jgi:hypothetical protein
VSGTPLPSALLTAALAVGCASGGTAPPPAGALDLSGPSFGTQHLVPAACRSGDRLDFYGVDLVDERAGIVARVVMDPVQGGVIRLFPAADPADPGIAFRRGDCSTFRVQVAPTGTTVNQVEVMRVAIELDCRHDGGDGLRGASSWDDCR